MLLKQLKFKIQKNYEAKKNHSPAANSKSKKSGQSSKAFSQSFKKNSCSNRGDQPDQFFNTVATGSNAIVVRQEIKR